MSAFSKTVLSKLSMAVFSGAVWTFAQTAARMILRIGTLAVLARLLDPVTFGLMAAIGVVLQMSEAVGLIGLAPALVQRKTVTEVEIGTAYAMAIFLAVALVALNLTFAGAIAAVFKTPELEPLVRAASIILILQSLSAVARAQMERELAFRCAAMITVSSLVGYSLVAIALAFAGAGVWALLAGQATQAALALALMWWFYPPILILRMDRGTAADLFRFGSIFSVGLLINRCAGQADYVIVGRLLGTDALGLYSRAYQLIINQAKTGSAALSQVLFPAFSRLQDEPERLGKAYRRALSISALPMAICSVFAWFLAGPLVLLILGDGWTETIEPFRWLAIAMVPHGANRVNGELLKATGRIVLFTGLQAFYLLAVASAAWVGAGWGIGGVALAVAIALWVHFLITSAATMTVQNIRSIQILHSLRPSLALGAITSLGFLASAAAAGGLDVQGYGRAIMLLSGGTVALGTFFFMPLQLLGPDAAWLRQHAIERLKVRKWDSRA